MYILNKDHKFVAVNEEFDATVHKSVIFIFYLVYSGVTSGFYIWKGDR